MRIRFWGTRGSLPKPAPEAMRYGGNTSCVEVRAEDGTLVILDSGTGIHALGQELAAAEKPPSGHLLITHTHWDHIQGFPFFTPLFVPGARWELYAPGFSGNKLKDILAGAMSYSYFPISLGDLGASVRYTDIEEGAFQLGSIRVTARYTNHPTLTVGYRIEAGGASVVYAPDHEPNSLHPAGAPPGARPLHPEDQRHVEFISGADLLIHDAQYTLEEYRGKVGWGHSPAEKAVDYALAGRARRLALFHHDPLRSDDELDRMVEAARHRADRGAHAPEVFAAAEGGTIELPEDGASPRADLPRPGQFPHHPHRILAVEEDAGAIGRLRKIMPPDTFEVTPAGNAESALRAAAERQPALVVLEPALTGKDGLEVCRALRASADPRLREVPIVVYTGARLGEKDLLDCYAAGATDHMAKSAPPAQLRARICVWLLRSARSRSRHAPPG